MGLIGVRYVSLETLISLHGLTIEVKARQLIHQYWSSWKDSTVAALGFVGVRVSETKLVNVRKTSHELLGKTYESFSKMEIVRFTAEV